MIQRIISKQITSRLFLGKILIVTGCRCCGKTTLVRSIINRTGKSFVWLDGSEFETRELLSKPANSRIRDLIGSAEILVIDEAQKINQFDRCISQITGLNRSLQIIAAGTSSMLTEGFKGSALIRRIWIYNLYPMSCKELAEQTSLWEESRALQRRLIFGSLPETVSGPGREKDILNDILNTRVYRDILAGELLQKPHAMERLIRALAFNISREVNCNELGQETGLDNQTVEKYITFLEKSFLVFRINSFHRRLDTELKKSWKVYFTDTGIRNAVINNFNTSSQRDDTEFLWENYIIAERCKYLVNAQLTTGRFFWRTAQKQSIDYLEEMNRSLHAYDFKWNPDKKARIPRTFLKAYPNSRSSIITQENYCSFLSERG